MQYSQPKFSVGANSKDAQKRYSDNWDQIDWSDDKKKKPETKSKAKAAKPTDANKE